MRLCVPFELKDDCKNHKGWWKSTGKFWMIPTDISNDNKKYLIENFKPITLNVPYDKKEAVKELGAVWNNGMKSWEIPACWQDKFAKYI